MLFFLKPGRYLFALILSFIAVFFLNCNKQTGIKIVGTGNTLVNSAVLFSFDDHSFPFNHNLRLIMHQPEKFAENPVLKRGPENSPDHFGVQYYGSIIRVDDRFRMWYIAVDEGINAHGGGAGIEMHNSFRPAYAESKDGIHWTRPDLGLVEYRGNKNNNLVQIHPAQLAAINLKVLHEPDDPDPIVPEPVGIGLFAAGVLAIRRAGRNKKTHETTPG